MDVSIDLKSDGCNFQFCRHNDNGRCVNEIARLDCLEVALAVLCIEVDNERFEHQQTD